MAWIYLIIAGLLEVAWALCLSASKGFSKPLPSVGFLVFAAVSFWLLALSLKTLPIGTAYAVWTGIGTVGAALLGMLWLDEPRDAARFACIALIIVGIAGLKVLSPH
ncbi:MAG TPA: multidrug efflux SMR transporter [Abditibacteriaceae bacterium]|jgi:quaternary ammonium compound-resistance protein SugE